MPSPSDFMFTQGPAPVSWAPSLVNFSALGDLGDTYYKTKQQQNQLAQQNAFQGGVPKTADGQIDVNQIMEKGAKLGGLQYMQGVMPYLIESQAGQQAAGAITGQSQQPSQAVNTTTGPQGIRGPGAAPPQQPAQDQSTGSAAPRVSSGGDNGQNTVMALTSQYYPPEQAGTAANNIGKAIGADVNQPLNPDQLKRAQMVLARTRMAQGQGQPLYQDPQPSQPAPAAPSTPLGGTSQAQALDRRAEQMRAQAARVGKLNPQAAEALNKQAQDYTDQAKQIRESIQKASEPTSAMKEAAAENRTVTQQKQEEEQGKADVKFYEESRTSFDAAAKAADDALPQIKLAQQYVNNPNFNAGAGRGFQDLLSRINVAFGGDPNKASVNEVFDKIRSSQMLDTIRSMKGTGAVRVPEMKMIETMVASRDVNANSVRTLLGIEERLAQRAQWVRDQMQANNGRVDNRLMQTIKAYKEANPLFTAAEIKDPRLIAPPTFRTPGEAMAAHLPRGTPIKTADGRVVYAP